MFDVRVRCQWNYTMRWWALLMDAHKPVADDVTAAAQGRLLLLQHHKQGISLSQNGSKSARNGSVSLSHLDVHTDGAVVDVPAKNRDA